MKTNIITTISFQGFLSKKAAASVADLLAEEARRHGYLVESAKADVGWTAPTWVAWYMIGAGLLAPGLLLALCVK